MYNKTPFKHVKPFVRSYDNKIKKAVTKQVPFGDDLVVVTSFIDVDDVHPIPRQVTVKMFNVDNSPSGSPIMQPLFKMNQTEQIYNSYKNLCDSMNLEFAELELKSISSETSVSSDPSVSTEPNVTE